MSRSRFIDVICLRLEIPQVRTVASSPLRADRTCTPSREAILSTLNIANLIAHPNLPRLPPAQRYVSPPSGSCTRFDQGPLLTNRPGSSTRLQRNRAPDARLSGRTSTARAWHEQW